MLLLIGTENELLMCSCCTKTKCILSVASQSMYEVCPCLHCWYSQLFKKLLHLDCVEQTAVPRHNRIPPLVLGQMPVILDAPLDLTVPELTRACKIVQENPSPDRQLPVAQHLESTLDGLCDQARMLRWVDNLSPKKERCQQNSKMPALKQCVKKF